MTAPTKRAPRCSPANGRCPDCRTPLRQWTFANAIEATYIELGCTMCEAVKLRLHVEACRCADCARGVDKLHGVEPVLPAADQATHHSGKPTE